MNLKPLFDRVIVERKDAEEKTLGGIIIPDNAKEKPIEGTVLAIGKDVKNLAIGDKILFPKFGVAEVKFNDKIYLIMKEVDILGVIDES